MVLGCPTELRPPPAKPTIPQKVTSVAKRARAAPDKDGGAAQARIIAHAKGRDPVGPRPGQVLVGGSPGGFGQLRPSPPHLGSGETLAPCVLEPGRSARVVVVNEVVLRNMLHPPL